MLALVLMMPLMAWAQDKPAYVLYNAGGKKVSFEKLLKEARNVDVVFFGELHNNPIAHWLQIELFKELYNAKTQNVVLGLEMLEADDQLKLDEYIKGFITDKHFEKEARLWPNYPTDYKPLVDSAKAKNLRVVATNIPRRYAALVAKEGLEGLNKLSDEAKKLMMPLPLNINYDLPAYKSLLESGMGGMQHGSKNFVSAQAVKDATMAHFILQNYTSKSLFFHINGAFHTDDQEGIVWFLKQSKPKIKTLTISTVLQADPTSLSKDNEQKADFILCVPENMTSTY